MHAAPGRTVNDQIWLLQGFDEKEKEQFYRLLRVVGNVTVEK